MNVCRQGDTGSGVCSAHDSPQFYTTVFSIGASTITVNDLSMALVTVVGISSCGHPTIALTGSQVTLGEDLNVHRVGDTGSNFGTYVANVGSENTISG